MLFLFGGTMAKFKEAEKMISEIKICKKCKTRNGKNVDRCRKCNSPYLRPKRKMLKMKK